MSRPKKIKSETISEVFPIIQEPIKPTPLVHSGQDPIYLCYARFVLPVPTSVNQEPVYEFSLVNKQAKYVVSEMIYTPIGMTWKCRGQSGIVPLNNINYARPITHG